MPKLLSEDNPASSYIYFFIKRDPQWQYESALSLRGRTLKDPNYGCLIKNSKFQNGFEVVSLDHNKLTLRSKLPKHELESNLLADEIRSYSGL